MYSYKLKNIEGIKLIKAYKAGRKYLVRLISILIVVGVLTHYRNFLVSECRNSFAIILL